MPPLWQLASLGAAIGGPAAAGWAFFGAALGDGDDAGDSVAQVCERREASGTRRFQQRMLRSTLSLSLLPQSLFAAVFALSAGLLELLVFQVAGFLDDR